MKKVVLFFFLGQILRTTVVGEECSYCSGFYAVELNVSRFAAARLLPEQLHDKPFNCCTNFTASCQDTSVKGRCWSLFDCKIQYLDCHGSPQSEVHRFDSGASFSLQCMSNKSTNNCLSFNITTEVSTPKENEIKAYFNNVYENRHDLCIGDIASRIASGIQEASSIKNISLEVYETMLKTLNEVFFSNFSSKWDGRTILDTRRIVDATDKILRELTSLRKTGKRNFSFIKSNLAFHTFRIEESEDSRNFYYPSTEQKKRILSRGSVNITFSEKKLRNCNFTIGVSIIDNYVEYIQETIREINKRDQRRPNSVILSVVINSDESDKACTDFTDIPIQLTLTLKEEIPANHSFAGCYLNTSQSTLKWGNTGVTSRMSSNTTVLIETSHLTSFAVLVSPTGSVPDSVALNVVSYVGCAVSVVCLSLTIICLLVFRKKLRKGVIGYVHVNLALALLLGFVIFMFGVELASWNSGLCIAVAALIQYFFLCAFLWMLGEGVILYVLLVRVFGNLADKWCILIPFCWGLPVPIVAISVGLLHDNYLVHINSKTFCWIKADLQEPAIWTFIGPIIFIILVNTVILALAVGSIIKTKLYVNIISSNKKSPLDLVKVTLKGSVVLLPLLGITWILGIFAVNSNTAVFAWLFTIFNSLQGFFIFVLHVLRNDYIWGMVKRKMCCKLPGNEVIPSSGKSLPTETTKKSVSKITLLNTISFDTTLSLNHSNLPTPKNEETFDLGLDQIQQGTQQ